MLICTHHESSDGEIEWKVRNVSKSASLDQIIDGFFGIFEAQLVERSLEFVKGKVVHTVDFTGAQSDGGNSARQWFGRDHYHMRKMPLPIFD